ncbi:MAG TPA: hypothetical protein ENH62_06765 [Marinobacter sp.]|nr:hypothetical protein [Marinobacter sp.]
MPQGMVQLNDGTWVPVGDAPGPNSVTGPTREMLIEDPQQPQPQPEPLNQIDPGTFAQQEVRSQFDNLQRKTNIQRRLINKQRKAMGQEKYLAAAQKLEAGHKKQAEDLYQDHQQKIGLMGRIEDLISQGILDEGQIAAARNLISRTAFGKEFGDLFSPIPEKGKQVNPFAQFNALQKLESQVQADQDRFRTQTETKGKGLALGPPREVTTLSKKDGPLTDDFSIVATSVYNPKLQTTTVTGDDPAAMAEFRKTKSFLNNIRRAIIAERETFGISSKSTENMLRTFGRTNSEGSTVGERVMSSAVANTIAKKRATTKAAETEYLRRRRAGMSQEEAANGLELR